MNKKMKDVFQCITVDDLTTHAVQRVIFLVQKTVQVMVLGINFYHNFILLYRRGYFMNV